ncbi:hypothetical protein PAMP_004036 [Pampus punctatissimus]
MKVPGDSERSVTVCDSAVRAERKPDMADYTRLDWDDLGWTATVSMRAEQLFFSCSSSSMRVLWSQPAQMTHYTCGISVRGGRLSCIHSNSTEKGVFAPQLVLPWQVSWRLNPRLLLSSLIDNYKAR